jgi:hypothetical protein
MPTFVECKVKAASFPNTTIGTDFDGVEFIHVYLSKDVYFKGRMVSQLILTASDSNTEIDNFYKYVSNEYKTPRQLR